MPPDEQIFTVTELSEHLRVHPTTIYRLLRRGLIPGFRVGSTWRFSRAAIEEWEHGQGLAEAMAGLDQPRRGRKKAIKPAATG
jgi:excisionase family DNA binding protein